MWLADAGQYFLTLAHDFLAAQDFSRNHARPARTTHAYFTGVGNSDPPLISGFEDGVGMMKVEFSRPSESILPDEFQWEGCIGPHVQSVFLGADEIFWNAQFLECVECLSHQSRGAAHIDC